MSGLKPYNPPTEAEPTGGSPGGPASPSGPPVGEKPPKYRFCWWCSKQLWQSRACRIVQMEHGQVRVHGDCVKPLLAETPWAKEVKP